MTFNGLQYSVMLPNGAQSEPFDIQTLRSYLQQGHIQPNTMIYDQSAGQWLPASQIVSMAVPQAPYAPMGTPPPYAPMNATPYTPAYASQNQSSKTGIIIGSIVAVVILTLIIIVVSATKTVLNRKTDIVTYDGKYAVTAVGLYNNLPGKNLENTQYYNTLEHTLIIIHKSKFQPTTLPEFDQVVNASHDSYLRRLSQAEEVSAPTALQLQKYPARQYEINYQSGGYKRRFRVTYIWTNDGVYYLSDSEREADVDRYRPELNKVVQSFHQADHGALQQ